jgi:phosphoribosylanthranilate isomerase
VKVKLCGFSDEIGVEGAVEAGCDFIGFIFFEKSVRFISAKNAAKISRNIPNKIAKVGVVVDAKLDELKKLCDEFPLDILQFHGNENAEFLLTVKKTFPTLKIIKALPIKEQSDLKAVAAFENCADFLLFDSKQSGEFGGSGKKFNWEILHNFSAAKPWFLSGGLNLQNIDEALKITAAKQIDISSGIEEIRGKKSPKLIKEFMAKIRSYQGL